ncbi:hypothetical protein ONS95_005758 [Cadophora gregata]|uniref:uncharacterized protein n=1 Tax=Cadophora gregata TaxID=51156 RepID=UPI0026DB107C|nr:uncharacterized protein ONS95_005758 [Cadophora gregata]KAK0103752.1 hypothetical protein ONS95_005758 [Cadophora gregata]
MPPPPPSPPPKSNSSLTSSTKPASSPTALPASKDLHLPSSDAISHIIKADLNAFHLSNEMGTLYIPSPKIQSQRDAFSSAGAALNQVGPSFADLSQRPVRAGRNKILV